MGFASETARASVEEGSTASDALLAEYSITPSNLNQLRTPRTPVAQDTVLQVYLQTRHFSQYLMSLARENSTICQQDVVTTRLTQIVNLRTGCKHNTIRIYFKARLHGRF